MHTEDYPDFYQGSCDITTINYGKMNSFLRDNDIVMVMFYNPTNKASKAVKAIYNAAAQITDRENTAFGAVNCGKDSDVCVKEGVFFNLPQFKVYAFGKKVGEMQYWESMTANEIARYIENLPVKRPLLSSPQKKFY